MLATRTVSRRRTLAAPVAFTMRVDATIRDKALYAAEQQDESLAKAVRRMMLDYIAAYEQQHGPIQLPPAA
jgi:predicted HicB family RNase H-like nuclease